MAKSCNIALNRLAIDRERVNPDIDFASKLNRQATYLKIREQASRLQTLRQLGGLLYEMLESRTYLFIMQGDPFGTRAIDSGAPLSAVKEVMGHADIHTTTRYVHATDEGKRRAVEAAASGGVKSNPATSKEGDRVIPSRKYR